ncbi:Lrp/AsnC family transcriptional regulator [Microbacterium sp. Marseille-Q6965]|uniref:Lrp/AsnC family transcriptional regulator n=1 Tax=Microbacterium sp. Marseille-Q6965 TaxID=2965072 RepID=UPI0021B732A3|nr:Lrp/AsnC family transcriptional regulator [Microbacterium sp. Marseille-Q6965]
MTPLDRGDIALVAALQRAPRASLTALADVLGASASTISRRYARLVSERLLHVSVSVPWSLTSPRHPSVVWLRCRPGTSTRVAEAVAALPGVQSVFQVAGVADLHVTMHPGAGGLPSVLLEDIPAIDGVASTSTCLVLGTASRAGDWSVTGVLDAEQDAALRRLGAVGEERSGPIRPAERELIRLLVADGRLGVNDAAHRLGVTRATASRMIAAVVDSGCVRPRVDIEPALLGYPLGLFASIRSHPAEVEATLARLSRHPSVRFTALTTGHASLLVQAVARDESDARAFLTTELGSYEGIQSVSVSTLLRTVRRNWRTVDREGRLGPCELVI